MVQSMSFNFNFYNQHCNGTPVIFIHGFMGNGKDWETIIELIDRPAITIDLPGHGLNSNFSYKSIADVATDLIANLKLDLYQLVGYSMGGRLALEMLHLAPYLFKSAIIESAHPGVDDPHARLKADQELISIPFQTFLTKWYQAPLFGRISEHSTFAQLIDKRLENCPDKLQKSLNILSVGTQRNLWSFLESTKIPITYITGELDLKYHQIGIKLTQINPFIKHKSFHECGHNVHIERAKDFAKLIITQKD